MVNLSSELAADLTLSYFGGDICGFDWVFNPSGVDEPGIILFVLRILHTRIQSHTHTDVMLSDADGCVNAFGSFAFLHSNYKAESQRVGLVLGWSIS